MGIYKKLFVYAGNRKKLGYGAIIVSVLSVFSTVWGYYFIYLFLSDVFEKNDLTEAGRKAIYCTLFLTLGALLYFLSGTLSHLLGFRLESNLRKKGTSGLTESGFDFIDTNSSGLIRKAIDDNASKTHMAVAHMIPDNSQAFLTPVLVIILAFFINPLARSVILLLCIICGFLMIRMNGGEEFLKLYNESLERLSSETVEYIRGIKVVKIFGVNVRSFKNLFKAINDYSDYALKYALSCEKPFVFYQELFFGITPLVMIPIFLFFPYLHSTSTAVSLMMIFFMSGVIMVSYMRIMWAQMNLFEAKYAVDTLEDLYSRMKSKTPSFGNNDKIRNFVIEFRNVSFSYSERKVLEDLSFKLGEGKIYAFTGSSGSGKSTIAKLISGFYSLDSGTITIGGKNLEEYSEDAVTEGISFLFQDSRLFSVSIYDNVALAKKGAAREEVMNALYMAECGSILDKFPERENTIIGSKGVYLSGGETQRIAIARVLLKNSGIVILDEASASLDPENEHELQKAFKSLIGKRTVIMIAHRLTAIRNVDEILLIEKGKIMERGSHEYLMGLNGHYKSLYSKYTRAAEWRV